MIERTRQRGKRSAVLGSDYERRVDGDRADWGQWKPERGADPGDPLAHRGQRGETQFVIVAAREQQPERQLALGAAELRAQLVRAGDCRNIDGRADTRSFENMSE